MVVVALSRHLEALLALQATRVWIAPQREVEAMLAEVQALAVAAAAVETAAVEAAAIQAAAIAGGTQKAAQVL